LERLANQHREPLVATPRVLALTPPPATDSKIKWLSFPRTEVPKATTPTLVSSPEAAVVPDDALPKAEAELAAASAITPPPAMLSLSELLGLSAFERDVMLLCAGMELDTGMASLCGVAQGDAGRPYPTFALAMLLFDKPAWDALSPDHPLRYWRLIELRPSMNQPLTVSPIQGDERILNYIKGLNFLDDRLSGLLSIVEPESETGALAPSQQAMVDSIVDRLKSVPKGEQLPAIQLLGSDSESKLLLASQVTRALNISLYRVPSSLLPIQPAELETLARLCQRECLLLRMGLYLEAGTLETNTGAGSTELSRFVARLDGVIFIDSADRVSALTEACMVIDVVGLTSAEQSSVWRAELGYASADSPAALAGQFSLNQSAIRRIARQTLDEQSSLPFKDRLWDACLSATRPGLDLLAQRLEPKATWDDLVLPPAQSNLLRQIAAQVGQRSQVYQQWEFGNKMSRGFGISALFAGDSGTGKTMAAEVIANQLRLNLYRIDLSAVVSKYIGETEKNLRRLFDAAENGGAILFFDEADALFGKRSEVKDSHDRYANIEINYLLQRMEAYGGLAILATNMKSALDQAFMRRLRFVVDFPFPTVEERKGMWQKAFPAKVPVSGIDLDALAGLNLTGGNIQSIALNAAFLAAHAGGPVTQSIILDAARTELRKLGRVVNELQFRRNTKAGAA
jgi:hypothetical protein